jgi:hypothetical protein
MRVKGKALSSFLGHVKTDMARLSVEAFPERINKQLAGLIVLPRMALCWFDLQIEKRIATLRANFYEGINGGNHTFKIGFLCLIGIAHLPEKQASLKFRKQFELRPCTTTNIGAMLEEELASGRGIPERV